MIKSRTPFPRICCALLLLVLAGARTAAQSQPATIPTVVAQAMVLWPDMFGRPQFFDGRLPTGWPPELVPSGARILGGSVIGDSAMFRVQIAVFAFAGQSKPAEILRALLTQAGYGPPKPQPPSEGGFVGSAPPEPGAMYCKGSSAASFGPVDSTQAPLVVRVSIVDGEMGRQNCNPTRDRTGARRFPVEVPALSPPRGAMTFGGGSTWSGDDGTVRSTLRTTIPADSVLAHYSAQLVSGGWKTEGRPAIADGVGVQRFTFRNDEEDWKAALLVIAVGDRREIRLELSKSP